MKEGKGVEPAQTAFWIGSSRKRSLSAFACAGLGSLFALLVLFVGSVPLIVGGAARADAGVAEAAEKPAAAPKMNKLLEAQLARIPSGEKGVRELLDPMRSRLALSDDQEKVIRPLIEAGVASMGQIRDRFEAGEIPPMALMTQLMLTGKKMAAKIEPNLSEKQQEEYRIMRQQKRREMMQEMMKGANQAGAAKP